MTAKPAAPDAPVEETGPEPTPVLDLDTLTPKRMTILIDKKAYELRGLGDFGVEEQHLINAETTEYDQLWAANPKDLKSEERKRLKLILDRLTAKALDAPAGVIAKLNDEQRKRLVAVFTSASAENWQRALETLIQKLLEVRESSTSES